jgi:hypothetical protein
MSVELVQLVAAQLRQAGLNAVVWDSGGGAIGVGICPGDAPPDSLRFFFGTADANWSGEVIEDDGETVGSIETNVSTQSTEPGEIAAAIILGIGHFVQTGA